MRALFPRSMTTRRSLSDSSRRPLDALDGFFPHEIGDLDDQVGLVTRGMGWRR